MNHLKRKIYRVMSWVMTLVMLAGVLPSDLLTVRVNASGEPNYFETEEPSTPIEQGTIRNKNNFRITPETEEEAAVAHVHSESECGYLPHVFLGIQRKGTLKSGAAVKKLYCETCGKEFTSVTGLANHLNSNPGHQCYAVFDTSKLVCSVCGKTYNQIYPDRQGDELKLYFNSFFKYGGGTTVTRTGKNGDSQDFYNMGNQYYLYDEWNGHQLASIRHFANYLNEDDFLTTLDVTKVKDTTDYAMIFSIVTGGCAGYKNVSAKKYSDRTTYKTVPMQTSEQLKNAMGINEELPIGITWQYNNSDKANHPDAYPMDAVEVVIPHYDHDGMYDTGYLTLSAECSSVPLDGYDAVVPGGMSFENKITSTLRNTIKAYDLKSTGLCLGSNAIRSGYRNGWSFEYVNNMSVMDSFPYACMQKGNDFESDALSNTILNSDKVSYYFNGERYVGMKRDGQQQPGEYYSPDSWMLLGSNHYTSTYFGRNKSQIKILGKMVADGDEWLANLNDEHKDVLQTVKAGAYPVTINEDAGTVNVNVSDIASDDKVLGSTLANASGQLGMAPAQTYDAYETVTDGSLPVIEGNKDEEIETDGLSAITNVFSPAESVPGSIPTSSGTTAQAGTVYSSPVFYVADAYLYYPSVKELMDNDNAYLDNTWTRNSQKGATKAYYYDGNAKSFNATSFTTPGNLCAALNIDLNKVVAIQKAEDGEAIYADNEYGSTLRSYTEERKSIFTEPDVHTDYTFTLESDQLYLDTDIAGKKLVGVIPGQTYSIDYTASTTPISSYRLFVSAAIYDKEDNLLYRGHLAPVDASGSGTVELTIPGELSGSGNKLALYVEEIGLKSSIWETGIGDTGEFLYYDHYCSPFAVAEIGMDGLSVAMKPNQEVVTGNADTALLLSKNINKALDVRLDGKSLTLGNGSDEYLVFEESQLTGLGSMTYDEIMREGLGLEIQLADTSVDQINIVVLHFVQLGSTYHPLRARLENVRINWVDAEEIDEDDTGITYQADEYGIHWYYKLNGNGQIVSLYTTDTDLAGIINSNAELIVPAAINDLKVIKVGGTGGSNAPEDFEERKTAHTFIPTSVTGFRSIVFPEGIVAIADKAFNGVMGSGFDVILPGSVGKVGDSAFLNSGIKSLRSTCTNEDGLTIEKKAFGNCISLESVIIKTNKDVTVAENAFANSNTKELQIVGEAGQDVLDMLQEPTKITIGESAFSGNTLLESIYMRANELEIRKNAFEGDAGVKDISLICVTKGSLEEGAFKNAKALENLYIYGGTQPFTIGMSAFENASSTAANPGVYNFDGHFIRVGTRAFENNTGVREIYFGNDANRGSFDLASNAFANATGLTKLCFKAGGTIGPNAFYGADNLTQLYFGPNGGISIGANAFESSDSLTKVKLPANVSTGNNSFKDCDAVREIEVDGNLGSGAFAGCDNIATIMLGESAHIYNSWNEGGATPDNRTFYIKGRMNLGISNASAGGINMFGSGGKTVYVKLNADSTQTPPTSMNYSATSYGNSSMEVNIQQVYNSYQGRKGLSGDSPVLYDAATDGINLVMSALTTDEQNKSVDVPTIPDNDVENAKMLGGLVQNGIRANYRGTLLTGLALDKSRVTVYKTANGIEMCTAEGMDAIYEANDFYVIDYSVYQDGMPVEMMEGYTVMAQDSQVRDSEGNDAEVGFIPVAVVVLDENAPNGRYVTELKVPVVKNTAYLEFLDVYDGDINKIIQQIKDLNELIGDNDAEYAVSINELTRQLNAYLEEIMALQKTISENSAEIQNLKDQINSLKEERDRLVADKDKAIKELQDENAALSASINQLKVEKEKLLAEKQQLEQEIRELRDAIKDLDDLIAVLEDQLSKLTPGTDEYKDLQARIQELKRERDEKQRELDAKLARLAEIEARLEEIDAEIARLTGQIESNKALIRQLEQEKIDIINEYNRRIESLEDQVRELQGLLDAETIKFNDLLRNYENLENQIRRLEYERDAAKARLKTVLSNIADLENQLAELRAYYDTIADKDSAEAKETMDSILVIMEALEDAYREKAELEEKIRSLDEQISQLRLEATEEMRKLIEQLANQDGEIATLRDQLDAAYNELNELTREYEAQKAILQGQIDSLNTQIDAVNATIRGLYEDYEAAIAAGDAALAEEIMRRIKEQEELRKSYLEQLLAKQEELENLTREYEAAKKTLQNRIDSLTKQLMDAMNNTNDLYNKIEMLKAQIAVKETLRTEYEERIKEIIRYLTTGLDENGNPLTDEKRQALEMEKSTKETQLALLENEIAILKKQLALLETILTLQENSVLDMEAIRALREQIAEQQKEIDAFEGKIQSYKDMIATLDGHLKQFTIDNPATNMGYAGTNAKGETVVYIDGYPMVFDPENPADPDYKPIKDDGTRSALPVRLFLGTGDMNGDGKQESILFYINEMGIHIVTDVVTGDEMIYTKTLADTIAYANDLLDALKAKTDMPSLEELLSDEKVLTVLRDLNIDPAEVATVDELFDIIWLKLSSITRDNTKLNEDIAKIKGAVFDPDGALDPTAVNEKTVTETIEKIHEVQGRSDEIIAKIEYALNSGLLDENETERMKKLLKDVTDMRDNYTQDETLLDLVSKELKIQGGRASDEEMLELIRSLWAKIESLENKINFQNGEIDSLEEDVAYWKGKAGQGQGTPEEAAAMIESLNSQLNDMNEKYKALQKEFEDYKLSHSGDNSKELETLRSQLAEKNEQINNLKSEVNGLKNENSNLSGQVKTLTDKVNTLTNTNTKLETEKNYLTKENNNLTSEKATLQKQYDAKVKELEDYMKANRQTGSTQQTTRPTATPTPTTAPTSTPTPIPASVSQNVSGNVVPVTPIPKEPTTTPVVEKPTIAVEDNDTLSDNAVSENEPDIIEPEPDPTPTNGFLWVLLVILLLIAIAGVAVYFLFIRKVQNKQEAADDDDYDFEFDSDGDEDAPENDGDDGDE